MIKQMLFLRWCASHRLPVMRNGKLTEYGKRRFAIWERRVFSR
jgi:hypothetical protein